MPGCPKAENLETFKICTYVYLLAPKPSHKVSGYKVVLLFCVWGWTLVAIHLIYMGESHNLYVESRP